MVPIFRVTSSGIFSLWDNETFRHIMPAKMTAYMIRNAFILMYIIFISSTELYHTQKLIKIFSKKIGKRYCTWEGMVLLSRWQVTIPKIIRNGIVT